MWTTAGAILEVSKSGSNTFYLTAITKKLRYLATICNQKSVFGTTGNLSADQVRLDYKYARKHAGSRFQILVTVHIMSFQFQMLIFFSKESVKPMLRLHIFRVKQFFNSSHSYLGTVVLHCFCCSSCVK